MANFSSQSIINLFANLKTQAETSGLFQRVLGHEPRSAPAGGFSYALWLGPITPVPGLGGLTATAGRVEIQARIYVPFLEKSEDQIETDMMRRVLEMIGHYSGAFTVGGTVYAIDLEGMHGAPLEAGNLGYIDLGGTICRVAELSIPVLIDNLWTQGA